MKHHTEDFKQSAVNYYLNNNVSMDDVCEIYELYKKEQEEIVDTIIRILRPR